MQERPEQGLNSFLCGAPPIELGNWELVAICLVVMSVDDYCVDDGFISINIYVL